ncbi:uncharacterized protein STEHIDRAFT_158707 [Stereum hirsutum FP-91666 SS1]|uniref:uncharacterized protein n=1 Tax=Stereum hirsutum (strain FP-91666) TaxID=721885 RepID=UPI000444A0D1|nr:uncharacterized protein STEHIDRAFT_158707 [Stereum hirsutum FP-91666 SS1]EIM85011.1 hypothetical protein STEHIDRAFT_158707 [Stereum hirsutum FP-91666 SS1]
MAEASVSVLGHLVVIAVNLAKEETNAHRVKVLARSFKAFPALVNQVQELNEFQTDEVRLQIEADAIRPGLIQQWEEFNTWSKGLGKWEKFFKYIPRREKVKDIKKWSNTVQTGISQSITSSTKLKLEAQNVAHRTEIALAHARGDMTASESAARERERSANYLSHVETENSAAELDRQRFRNAIADAGLQLSSEYEESRALAIDIVVDVLRNGIAVQSSDQSGETFREALERLKLVEPFSKVAPA